MNHLLNKNKTVPVLGGFIRTYPIADLEPMQRKLIRVAYIAWFALVVFVLFMLFFVLSDAELRMQEGSHIVFWLFAGFVNATLIRVSVACKHYGFSIFNAISLLLIPVVIL